MVDGGQRFDEAVSPPSGVGDIKKQKLRGNPVHLLQHLFHLARSWQMPDYPQGVGSFEAFVSEGQGHAIRDYRRGQSRFVRKLPEHCLGKINRSNRNVFNHKLAGDPARAASHLQKLAAWLPLARLICQLPVFL